MATKQKSLVSTKTTLRKLSIGLARWGFGNSHLLRLSEAEIRGRTMGVWVLIGLTLGVLIISINAGLGPD